MRKARINKLGQGYECYNCEFVKICDETINFDCPYENEEDYWEEDDEED